MDLIPSRQERIAELLALTNEIADLKKKYLQRKARTEEDSQRKDPPLPPTGYSTFREYIISGVVDRSFIPGEWHNYLKYRESLVSYRDRLLATVARRAGDPERYERYQNVDEWRRWHAGVPLPRPSSAAKEWARSLLRSGETYEETVYLVALQTMMFGGEQLTKSRAEAIKKAVNLEYSSQFGEAPPKLPRGWWHPAEDYMEPMPNGGFKVMGLAWSPANTGPQGTTPIVPYHLRRDATLRFSCWPDDPDFY